MPPLDVLQESVDLWAVLQDGVRRAAAHRAPLRAAPGGERRFPGAVELVGMPRRVAPRVDRGTR